MINFRVERGWSFDGYNIWWIEHRNGKAYIAKPISIEFTEVEECHPLPEPTLKIKAIDAQELIPKVKNALMGFSFLDKKELESTEKTIKAMQDHIDSLKQIVDSFTCATVI